MTALPRDEDIFTAQELKKILATRSVTPSLSEGGFSATTDRFLFNRRLEEMEDNENRALREERENSIFHNLSLAQVGNNLTQTIIDVISDISAGRMYRLDTYIGGERLMYLGILVVILSIFAMLVVMSERRRMKT